MIEMNQIELVVRDDQDSAQNLQKLLMPIQVRLKKTPGVDHTQTQNQNYHLVEVRRQPNFVQKQQQHEIPYFENVTNQNMNCLSYYRRKAEMNDPKIKLAICVCSYNQNRSMLQKSLMGVHKSLSHFKKSAGISSNSIIVIVVFDGIQKIHNVEGDQQENILPFFQRIDLENGLLHRKHDQKFNNMRFQQRYKNYKQAKRLFQQCKPNKRKYELDKIDPKIKQEYQNVRENMINKEFGNSFKTLNQHQRLTKLKQYEEQFDQKSKKRKVALQIAYQNIKLKCQKFLRMTQDTSIVYPMRYIPEKTFLDETNQEEPLTGEDNLLNVLMVVKHKNAKKLSSHALFFLGFCKLLQPQICILLDVGLEPQGDSIYRMYQHMVLNQDVGGSCGYMGLKVQRPGDEFREDVELSKNIDPVSYLFQQHIFDIQKAQRFEYHMGHLIDKPFQACFDFIHVLPGAFSCYRYQKVISGLKKYLAPALEENNEKSLQDENMYLAEDRILSLCLKADKSSFAYLPFALALVDPMTTLYGLLAQRRRWFNGSWFAFYNVFKEKDSIKSCWTKIQFFYYYIMYAVAYIGIGIYFSTLYLTVRSISYQNTSNQNSRLITGIVTFVYIMMIGSLAFLSLNQKSGDSRFQAIYYAITTLLGLYGIMVLILMLINLIQGLANLGDPIFMMGLRKQDPDYKPLVPTYILIGFMFGTIAMYGIQTVVSACFVRKYRLKVIFEVLFSVHHFLFYAPTYLHTFTIYSFCKIDDFTWGTKGLDKQEKNASNQLEQTKLDYKAQSNKVKKLLFVLKFLLWNICVSIVLCILVEYPSPRQIVITVLGGFFFMNTLVKFFFSMIYLICNHISCCKKEFPRKDENERLCRQTKIKLQRIKIGERIQNNIKMTLGKSGIPCSDISNINYYHDN